MSKKNMKKRLLPAVLTVALAFTWAVPADAYGTSGTGRVGKSYAGESNASSDQTYSSFGLVLNSPEQFDSTSEENPLEGYTIMPLSELYVGAVNKSDSYKGSFTVYNDTDSLGSSAFKLDNMDKVGSSTDFSFPSDDKSKREQTMNTCGADLDGDKKDEIVDIMLFFDDKDDASKAEIIAYDYDESGKKYNAMGGTLSYSLTDSSTDKKKFVSAIEADCSKGYTAITSGDFDGDGKDEVAAYVASDTDGKGSYVVILDYESGTLKETRRIYLSELHSDFAFRYKERWFPIVNLAATSISGSDDLVITACLPRRKDDDYYKKTQNTALAIYGYKNGSYTKRSAGISIDGSDYRMRFASACDMDLNGNGADELVIAGYKNIKLSDDKGIGKIDQDSNLVQVVVWNESSGKYEGVWTEPKSVNALDIYTESAYMEPAALTGAKLFQESDSDQLFLEGIIFSCQAGRDASSEKENFKDAVFTKKSEMAMYEKDDEAFISLAVSGAFCKTAVGQEQIVAISGDHKRSVGDTMDDIYYDFTWIWAEGSNIKSEVTDKSYIDSKNEDGDGTALTIAAINIDDDTMTYEYVGKEYGWSAPEVYAVLESPPYWQELEYAPEIGGGSTEYTISKGTYSGTEGEWGVGLGFHIGVTTTLGVGIGATKAEVGGLVNVSEMASYIGSYEESESSGESYSVSMPAGDDCVIVVAVPVVSYRYSVWVPDQVYTEEMKEQYQANKDQMTEEERSEYDKYKVGDTIPGHFDEMFVNQQLDPAFSALTMEEYNEAVAESDDANLSKFDEKLLSGKTMGDPTTYISDESVLEEKEKNGEIEALRISSKPVNIRTGEKITTVSFENEKESGWSHGFDIDLDLEIGGVAEAAVGFLVKSSTEVEMVWNLALNGGASWLHGSTEGIEVAAELSSLPEGTSADYGYSCQLATYSWDKSSDSADDLSGDVDPVILTYIVKDTTEDSAPPKLPQMMRVDSTTANQVVLKWENSTYRPADKYEIYEQNSNGSYSKIGTVSADATSYVVTGLEPDTEYYFSMKSIRDNLESCSSRWLRAVTKSEQTDAPVFTTEPEDICVDIKNIPDDLKLSCEVKKGIDDAYLQYQWQVLEENAGTGIPEWKDIKGADESEYIIPKTSLKAGEETCYRVTVDQIVTGTGSIQTVNSASAAVYAYESSTDASVKKSTKMAVNVLDGIRLGESTHFSAGDNVKLEISVKDSEGKDVDTGKLYMVVRDENGGSTFVREASVENGIVTVDIPPEKLKKGCYTAEAFYADKERGSYIASATKAVRINVGELEDTEDYYKITYRLGGGWNAHSNPDAVSPDGGNITLAKPSRKGYSFAGWEYINGEGERTALEGNIIRAAALENDITLYASWNPVTYNIRYVLNGGTNSKDNPDTYTIEDSSIAFSDPDRDGYIFAGWYTDKNFRNRIEETAAGQTGDLTLYAKWTKAGAGAAGTGGSGDPQDSAAQSDAGNDAGPKTGDEAPLTPMVIVLILSVMSLAAALKERKRSR
ncbi:MAG: InlB B-repeat-containing protein [Emergencia sp.]